MVIRSLGGQSVFYKLSPGLSSFAAFVTVFARGPIAVATVDGASGHLGLCRLSRPRDAG
jgi:hypothetical protein